jgi:hypothetical protein
MTMRGFTLCLPVLLGLACRSTQAPAPASDLGSAAATVGIAAASAERFDSGEVLFRISATLDNGTTQTLRITTNFLSAFDGMTLVVLRDDGSELARQSYTYHQSPYSPSNTVDVPPGRTAQDIVFPIRDLSTSAFVAQVRLEGGLPETAYASGLVSNTARLSVPALAGAASQATDGGETGTVSGWPAEVPPPPGLRSVETGTNGRGDRELRLEADGELEAAWGGWLAAAGAAGWQVADRHGGGTTGWHAASLFASSPDGPRAWIVLSGGGERALTGIWTDAPALGERSVAAPPGECVPVPQRSFRIRIEANDSTAPPSPMPYWGFVTLWQWDFDGDGTLDAIVPETEGASCPSSVKHTIYLVRGDCGHLVGTVQGDIDYVALRRAAPGEHGLPDVVATVEEINPWPGPGGMGASEVHTTRRTYRFDGTSYAVVDTDEKRVKRTCSPDGCPTLACTGPFDVVEEGSLSPPETR